MKHSTLVLAIGVAVSASMLSAAPDARSQTVETGYMVCTSQNRPAGRSFVSDIAEIRYVTTHVENWNRDEFRKVVSMTSGMAKDSLFTDCSIRKSYQEADTYRERGKTVRAREGMSTILVSYLPKSEPGY